eukprot:6327308-Pyramimonas_sp.AAC.1
MACLSLTARKTLPPTTPALHGTPASAALHRRHRREVRRPGNIPSTRARSYPPAPLRVPAAAPHDNR